MSTRRFKGITDRDLLAFLESDNVQNLTKDKCIENKECYEYFVKFLNTKRFGKKQEATVWVFIEDSKKIKCDEIREALLATFLSGKFSDNRGMISVLVGFCKRWASYEQTSEGDRKVLLEMKKGAETGRYDHWTVYRPPSK